MKKVFKFFICILLILLLFDSSVAYADMGPKPGIFIDVKGVEYGEEYYMTLLSDVESTGPFSVGNELGASQVDYKDAYRVFSSLMDKDDYYFLSYIEKLEGEDQFSWTYYPPNKFKICMYFPDRDLILISDIFERYAFNSYYDLNFKELGIKDQIYYFNNNEINIIKNYDYKGEIFTFILRVVFTIVIEYLIALLFFKPNKYQITLIIKTNIFTQIILNIGLNLILYFNGYLAYLLVLIPLELLVFIIEVLIYSRKMNVNLTDGDSEVPVIRYAFIANFVSAFVGYFLMKYLR